MHDPSFESTPCARRASYNMLAFGGSHPWQSSVFMDPVLGTPESVAESVRKRIPEESFSHRACQKSAGLRSCASLSDVEWPKEATRGDTTRWTGQGGACISKMIRASGYGAVCRRPCAGYVTRCKRCDCSHIAACVGFLLYARRIDSIDRARCAHSRRSAGCT